MQPTVGAELKGARRSLTSIAGETDLPADVVADIEDVIRTLKRTEGAWSQTLPYLVGDNARIEKLLARLVPVVPADTLAQAITALGPQGADGAAESGPTLLDVEVANERNERLRQVLSDLLAAVADGRGDAEVTVRSMILDCLRESLDARPW